MLPFQCQPSKSHASKLPKSLGPEATETFAEVLRQPETPRHFWDLLVTDTQVPASWGDLLLGFGVASGTEGADFAVRGKKELTKTQVLYLDPFLLSGVGIIFDTGPEPLQDD